MLQCNGDGDVDDNDENNYEITWFQKEPSDQITLWWYFGEWKNVIFEIGVLFKLDSVAYNKI